MKKVLFAFMAFAVVISSCKKNKTNDLVEAPSRTNMMTKTVINAGANDSIVRAFAYDASNRLTGYTQSSNPYNAARNFNFTYNIDGTLTYYY